MISMEQQINTLRRDMFLHRFNAELEYTKENSTSLVSNEERIEQLTRIIELANQPVNKKSDIKQDHQQLINNMRNGMYNQPWRKLPIIHKRHQFTEYVNKHHTKYAKTLCKQFSQLLEDGRYKADGQIEYDPLTATIISVPDLEVDDDDKPYFAEEAGLPKSRRSKKKEKEKKTTSKKPKASKKKNTTGSKSRQKKR